MNGSTSEIRIGDFGLSVEQQHAQSVLGTPEFMAPELFESCYTEKVDIYAFGMCILEMITRQYPYEECTNQVQIWRAVSNGIPPQALMRISSSEIRAFIELCLVPEAFRPSAQDLLHHPFLNCTSPDEGVPLVLDKKKTLDYQRIVLYPGLLHSSNLPSQPKYSSASSSDSSDSSPASTIGPSRSSSLVLSTSRQPTPENPLKLAPFISSSLNSPTKITSPLSPLFPPSDQSNPLITESNIQLENKNCDRQPDRHRPKDLSTSTVVGVAIVEGTESKIALPNLPNLSVASVNTTAGLSMSTGLGTVVEFISPEATPHVVPQPQPEQIVVSGPTNLVCIPETTVSDVKKCESANCDVAATSALELVNATHTTIESELVMSKSFTNLPVDIEIQIAKEQGFLLTLKLLVRATISPQDIQTPALSADAKKRNKQIMFDFHLQDDTAKSVAQEMWEELFRTNSPPDFQERLEHELLRSVYPFQEKYQTELQSAKSESSDSINSDAYSSLETHQQRRSSSFKRSASQRTLVDIRPESNTPNSLVESEKKSSRENSVIIGDQQFSSPEQPDKLTQRTLFNSGPDNIALNNVHAHYESVDFPQSTDPRWSQGDDSVPSSKFTSPLSSPPASDAPLQFFSESQPPRGSLISSAITPPRLDNSSRPHTPPFVNSTTQLINNVSELKLSQESRDSKILRSPGPLLTMSSPAIMARRELDDEALTISRSNFSPGHGTAVFDPKFLSRTKEEDEKKKKEEEELKRKKREEAKKIEERIIFNSMKLNELPKSSSVRPL